MGGEEEGEREWKGREGERDGRGIEWREREGIARGEEERKRGRRRDGRPWGLAPEIFVLEPPLPSTGNTAYSGVDSNAALKPTFETSVLLRQNKREETQGGYFTETNLECDSSSKVVTA
jgi:hypothetical protein